MNKKFNFVCPIKKCLKDNIKTAHWVGHSQFRSLDTHDCFKRTPVVYDIKDSVTSNKIKQSASEKNPDLLQEEE